LPTSKLEEVDPALDEPLMEEQGFLQRSTLSTSKLDEVDPALDEEIPCWSDT
ncbi:unnamed protein product, partial [Symbiodinium pilosum]